MIDQIGFEEASELASFGAKVLRAPKALDGPKRELDEYFEGKRERFELPAGFLDALAAVHRSPAMGPAGATRRSAAGPGPRRA